MKLVEPVNPAMKVRCRLEVSDRVGVESVFPFDSLIILRYIPREEHCAATQSYLKLFLFVFMDFLLI